VEEKTATEESMRRELEKTRAAKQAAEQALRKVQVTMTSLQKEVGSHTVSLGLKSCRVTETLSLCPHGGIESAM